MKKILGFKYLEDIYFTFLLAYMELIFHFAVFGFPGFNFIFALGISILIGLAFALIWKVVKKGKVRSIVFGVIVVLVTVFFIVHLIYYAVFLNFWAPFSMMGLAGQAFDFFDTIFRNVFANIVYIILFLLPVAFYFVFIIRAPKRQHAQNHILIHSGILIVAFALFFTGLGFTHDQAFSPYKTFFSNASISERVETFGAFTASILDGVSSNADGELILGDIPVEESQEPETSKPGITDVVVKSTYNQYSDDVINTLTSSIDQTGNSNLQSLNAFFLSKQPTNKNEYTGIFEGYNLIWITAEGFSKYAVDEQRTPVLYKMMHQGFDFENFYTPLYYGSTSGGEYVNLTANIPYPGGTPSMVLSGEVKANMYYTPGRVFQRLGYKTWGFHNNSYTYYERNLSHPNMGYNWIGSGNGYEPETTNSGKAYWPQPDSRLEQQSFPMYSSEEPFHVYYMSVSGHAEYNFSGNQQSYVHRDIVQDLPYSDTAKAYLACNYELELMLENLEKDLEAKGIADRTVIVLAADHIPYNYKDMCAELAGHTLNDDVFEWYESSLMIYSPSIKEHIKVSKHCGTMDILPTVLNLFGVDYDSRLMSGNDIFSDNEAFVAVDHKGSFISDKCFYNAASGKTTPIDGATVDDEYINARANKTKNCFLLSNNILNNNYYQYVENAVKANEGKVMMYPHVKNPKNTLLNGSQKKDEGEGKEDSEAE